MPKKLQAAARWTDDGKTDGQMESHLTNGAAEKMGIGERPFQVRLEANPLEVLI